MPYRKDQSITLGTEVSMEKQEDIKNLFLHAKAMIF